jgi:hypothetical protein
MMNWVIMPYVGNHNQTEQAVYDVLDQTLPDVHLLLIQQGGDPVPIISIETPRVHRWKHDPPLPSLSATWNRALKMVWEAGETHAWVVNNDVRLHKDTYKELICVLASEDALFVSAVGVTPEQFDPTADVTLGLYQNTHGREGAVYPTQIAKGGPDFSCFVITKACHDQYPFDEAFVPAYCEDLDYHRRLMIDGHRDKIFSVNLPFLHFASGTLKGMAPEAREKKEAQINTGSRMYYERKWGGPVNHERWTKPFDFTTDRDGVSTPELQHGQTT